MNRKLFAGLAPTLAIAALALATLPSAAAAAPPHWFSEGKLVGSETVPVKTYGKLIFHLTQFGGVVECKVKDSETITNPPTGGPGTDEMLAFRLMGCKSLPGTPPICTTKIEVIALGLPWHTHLAEEPPAPGVRDVFEGVALEFRCKKGMNYGVFSGRLNPKVGNSVLEFEGEQLSGGFGTVTVTGIDKLHGPAGDKKITAA
jgi:hypothetical protein